MTRHLARYMSVSLLLLVYAFTRLYNLMAFPLFIDESLYVYRAQIVRGGDPLLPVRYSRTLHAWYLAVLGPYPPAGGWVGRVAIITLGLLGAAALYGLVRSFVSHRAGLIALLLWTATPYALFYERMLLADPALDALAIVVVWIAWQMMRTRQRRFAPALGLGLVALLLAKASGVVWLPLPFVALVLAAKLPWRQRIVLGTIAYGTFGILWGSFTLVLRWRHINYFGEAERFVGGVDENIFERISRNIGNVLKFDLAYVGLPMLILAIAGAVYWLWQNPRSALFVIAALGMGGGGAIAFGHDINSRYALGQVVWIVLFGSVGIGLVIERYPRWRPAVYLAVTLWIAVFFAPFAYRMWEKPADLSLVGNDENEYIRQDTSGFGVTSTGEALRGMELDTTQPVLGLVANCQTLRIAAYPVKVTCPVIYWNTKNQQLMQQAEQWAAKGPIYVVGEELNYIDLTQLPKPNELLLMVERPGGMRPIRLYRIEQGAQQPAQK
jgi:4-amino-4-deoxy-L-arabinose transferase-like glycosyltransferase